ncbi:hypothetical protein GOV11_04520, partial [Candidatus Woesearchaeota archaeon]|nr:hypothetical protein [Candidatus Woesearchaeota archaeon]
MSDLRSRLSDYNTYISQGIDPLIAQNQANVSDLEITMSNSIFNPPKEDTVIYAEQAAAATELELTGQISTGTGRDSRMMKATSLLAPDGDPRTFIEGAYNRDEDLSWFGKGLEFAGQVMENDKFRAFVETISVPQQLITHALAGEDLRKAVPGYLRPEEWNEDSELDYSYVSFIDGIERKLAPELWSMEEMFEETEKMSGWKRNVSRGSYFLASFTLDVASDPLTYASGAGLGSAAVK